VLAVLTVLLETVAVLGVEQSDARISFCTRPTVSVGRHRDDKEARARLLAAPDKTTAPWSAPAGTRTDKNVVLALSLRREFGSL